MAEYKGIKGFKVQYLSADPSDPIVGQVWYNGTTKALKFTDQALVASIATGGNLNTARYWLRGFGTLNAGVVASGNTPPSQQTEEYNGTSWTNSNNLINVQMRGGSAQASPQTAGLIFGGRTPPGTLVSAAEEYDGTSWTAGGALPATIDGNGGAGTQTAGLSYGGRNGPPFPNATNEYNGTSWTAGGTMGTATYNFGSAGTQTAALSFGGEPGPTPIATTQSYDGTSWSLGADLINARYANGGAGQSNTAAISFGGAHPTNDPTTSIAVEEYDGTSWTAKPNLPAVQKSSGTFGTTFSAVSAGGSNPSPISTTFEFSNDYVKGTKTVTVS